MRYGMRTGVIACLLAALAVAGTALGASQANRAEPQSGKRLLTLYSVANGVQFLNNADDIARGSINNPFNAATNKLQPKSPEKGAGPFAGDVTVFSFDLYADVRLKKHAGLASYTCYFNYNNHALCMAYFRLDGKAGSVLASGPVDFSVTGFTLAITGGTSQYLAASGEVVAVPSAHQAQRLEFTLAKTGTTAPRTRRLTVDAVATTAQFMNHADDRIRGMSNNPFTPEAQSLVIIAKGKEKDNGPFPGDDVLYSFSLRSVKSRTQAAGSAIFTCYYDFLKRATCDAYFDLANGLVLASGQVTFGSTHFTLTVTGGTGRYVAATGEVVATPLKTNAQRFGFVLK
jgi:hypothetical protein